MNKARLEYLQQQIQKGELYDSQTLLIIAETLLHIVEHGITTYTQQV